MNFQNRHNQGPVFSGITGGAGAGVGAPALPPATGGAGGAGGTATNSPATNPGDAQSKVGGGLEDAKTGYQNIFNDQMKQQMELYAIITKLNDKKNEQSSFLSLAKSVSEMV